MSCPLELKKKSGVKNNPLTSNKLEGAAEYIQGAHEQVEKPQEENELPNPLENAENLPFGVSLCGREEGRHNS